MSEAEATPPKSPVTRTVPWRGRRRVADPRDAWVHVRCTVTEHAAMTAAAAQAGLSVGAFLRAVGLGTAGPRAVRKPAVDRVELARLLGEIGKLGSNVNQLAYAANCGDIPAGPDLDAAVSAVDEMRAAVMKALGRGH